MMQAIAGFTVVLLVTGRLRGTIGTVVAKLEEAKVRLVHIAVCIEIPGFASRRQRKGRLRDARPEVPEVIKVHIPILVEIDGHARYYRERPITIITDIWVRG